MGPAELLELFATKLHFLSIPNFETGSIASINYGEPRFTNDIYVVAGIRLEDVERFCKAFSEDEFYLNPDAVRTAVLQKFQFNIIHTMSGLKVDVMIPHETEFESSRRSRVKIISTPRGMRIPFVSPEDLIIRKMQYFKEGGSDKHLRDIASMLLIQADAIDRDYISSWAEKLNVKEVWQEILTEENRVQRVPQARHKL